MKSVDTNEVLTASEIHFNAQPEAQEAKTSENSMICSEPSSPPFLLVDGLNHLLKNVQNLSEARTTAWPY